MKISAKIFRLYSVAAIAGVLLALNGIFRPWWFDEVLTVTEFALLPDIRTVYHAYVIPNNQIVYTVFVHLWINIFENTVFLRLGSLAAGITVLTAAWHYFRGRRNWQIIRPMLALWAVSHGFAVYATALRSYIFGALAVLVFFIVCGEPERQNRTAAAKFLRSAILFISAAAAVGMVPFNLFALGAAVIIQNGRIFREKKAFIRALMQGICALAAFALFYLPILPELLQVSRLREASASRGEAILGAYLSLLPFCGIFTAGAFAGKVPWTKRLLWLFPAIFGLAWAVAPFPRIYFPWQILFIVLAAAGSRRILPWMKAHRGTFFVLTMLWGVLWLAPCVREAASGLCGGEKGDDFFAPYYMRESFSPRATLDMAAAAGRGGEKIYASFDADMWSLYLEGKMPSRPGADVMDVVFDTPANKIHLLKPGDFVILHRSEDPEKAAGRFGKMKKIGENGFHCVLQIVPDSAILH